MKEDYKSIKIEKAQAAEIAWRLYQIKGEIIPLPGEFDFNFKINCENASYILKINRPDVDLEYIKFQEALLKHVNKSKLAVHSPKILPDVNGNYISKITDTFGNKRLVRMLSWVKGRLWSSVNPQKEELLASLGEQAGIMTKALQDFDHSAAHRDFEWDIARADWTFKHIHLFKKERQRIIKTFQDKFKKIKAQYNRLRKGVVHNDANDNNIIVTNDMLHPKVKAIIDFGDAVYTQVINDLAITVAYAIMNKPDVLKASLSVITAYNKQFSLLEEELDMLFTLVAMRLVISVTKSALNKEKEPENKYLLVSEEHAWNTLEKWLQVNEKLAYFTFRGACGFRPHPSEKAFAEWADKQKISLRDLFPDLKTEAVCHVDMSVSSTWLGSPSEYKDNDFMALKLVHLQQQHPNALIAGGYLETRSLYSTSLFRREGNNGPEYRTVHLGTDFWVKAQTPVHALFDATVLSINNNEGDKDYGPTLILEHKTNNGIVFYSLYGHLSKSSLKILQNGQSVQKGDLIGYVGLSSENGNWVPHLHFQLFLDMLGNKHDFPGVAFPDDVKTWKSICPDPNLLFRLSELKIHGRKDNAGIAAYRKQHLGKALSLAYTKPLQIVRGAGVFLIDNQGRRYLDTVNNVAHVGHENARVVKAGQEQMALLNTNTRYLHENINAFVKALLRTFPEALSVVHFVNSGSEANELAIRMARTYTGQKDMVAVEIGYHGNTTGCIDISSYKFDGKGGKGAPEYTHIVPLPDTYRGLYQGPDTGPLYAAHVKEQINNIQHKRRNVAGFICESILSCGGQIELPKNYLKIAAEAVRKAGGLYIADEVQVGCGRVGRKFWAFQLHEVVPDIVTIGKPIGNGHPLAAVVCTREVAAAFETGMEYFNTFGGNPVSCAVGQEVLKVIKDEKLQENAQEIGTYLKTEFEKLQKEFQVIGDVRGQGLFLGFEMADKNKKPLPGKAAYLINRMKELGILMSTDGKDNNVLKIKPPLVFSKDNANELLLRLKTVLNEDFMTSSHNFAGDVFR